MTSPTFGSTPKPKAIIGAAKRVRIERFQRVGEPWQPALWEIYRDLGPVHYGMTFKQSAAQRVDYFAAESDDKSEEPVPTENQTVIEAVERLGDVNAIVGEFVVQENVAGEGYLHGRDDEDDEFEVLSTVEVQARQTDPNNPLGDYLLRIWRPAPWKRSEPDSPLLSVKAQCQQLLLLNDQVTSTAMSRIPAGFLLVASELSFPGNADNPPDTGANIDNDPFMEEIVEILTLAVTDPDSAARIAPNVIRGPHELIKDGFRYVDISRSMDETFAKMREELLRQIAGGINLPAEILTGLADLNHWSLWGVDESTAKHHVDPDVLQILQGLTEGYLWPLLEESGMNRAEARRFRIWRDYSDLTARPMTVEQALALNVEGIINDAYVRKVANVPDDFAGDGQPKTAQAIDPEPDRGPPLTAAAVDISGLTAIDRDLAGQIIEASEAAFTRALERAGAKIRTKTKKNPQMHAAIDGVANELVPRTLGAGRVEQLQLTADQLLPADTFDPLAARLEALIEQGQADTANTFEQLTTVRMNTSGEEEDRDAAIAFFITALFAAATARLFTDSPDLDPAETGEFSDHIATAQMVVDLLTRSGGGAPDVPDSPRGLALGQRTRAAFRDNGYRVESLTWKWGYYRTPATPFEPHQTLNGDRFLSRDDPRMNGRYPGDHRFCTCELVPTVLPEG